MLLRDYDNPTEEELEAAFREVYHFIQGFTVVQTWIVWLLCKMMGDRLYKLVAQKMHRSTMQTLQHASCGMHSDFFKRKREQRKDIGREAKRWVQSVDAD